MALVKYDWNKKSGLPNSPAYWDQVRTKARELNSDGCTGVPEFKQDACFEHDIHWRTGITLDGTPISLWHANTVFRWRIHFLPMAWWIYLAVTGVALLKTWTTRKSKIQEILSRYVEYLQGP